MTEDEGFLQRWSRRKQSALRDDEVSEDESQTPGADEEAGLIEPSAEEASSAELEAGSASEAELEPEPPGDEDMPPLESIDESGSVAAFLSPRVSEGLRRAALRRLFRQPKYNVVDMLDDYAEDYSKPVALGSVVTADMRYRAEQAAKRMERKLKESLADKDEEGESVAATDVNTEAPAEPIPRTGEETMASAGDRPETTDGLTDDRHESRDDDRDDDLNDNPDRRPG
ncbi:DUF3306 domain-containing protein [Wenzhouxiangella limi]|uniref:DUF3306 domain-containing protein n=1 Tax=Wenzhouxiangella limi TaxID=2707351 RepID=A0A845UUX6_9GAMM|nr:DUF3306 domain-containing protein [Wenzhouxiangella limi]NDY95643.1 DUF3306 domain-containing protein [Wenzhouxiangella limi]